MLQYTQEVILMETITKEFSDELKTVGLDVSQMVEHFMDREDMFLKYLLKFFGAADSVVKQFAAAAEKRDYPAALFSVHALKGLSGNIGLKGVFEPARKMVDDIRAEQYADFEQDAARITETYCKAREIVARYTELT